MKTRIDRADARKRELLRVCEVADLIGEFSGVHLPAD